MQRRIEQLLLIVAQDAGTVVVDLRHFQLGGRVVLQLAPAPNGERMVEDHPQQRTLQADGAGRVLLDGHTGDQLLHLGAADVDHVGAGQGGAAAVGAGIGTELRLAVLVQAVGNDALVRVGD